MKIKALAPWFGSKRTMAGDIIAELGNHSAYWEPFCGSAAVLLVKPRSQQETLNDLQSDLVNLAVVTADRELSVELFARTSVLMFSAEVLKRARDHLRSGPVGDMPDIDRAVSYFTLSWMGRNGSAGCPDHIQAQMSVRWTPNGGHSPSRFAAAVASIPEWYRRLQNVCVLNRDAFEVLDKIDDHRKVAVYVDPPYFLDTRGNGGGSRYEYDFEPSDHERLATALQRFRKARIVLSYYDHQMLDDLYDGWTKRDMERAKNLSNQHGRGPRDSKAPEVLLMNGSSNVRTGNRLFA